MTAAETVLALVNRLRRDAETTYSGGGYRYCEVSPEDATGAADALVSLEAKLAVLEGPDSDERDGLITLPLIKEIQKQRARADAAEAKITAALALHTPTYPLEGPDVACFHCAVPATTGKFTWVEWPCPTVRALSDTPVQGDAKLSENSAALSDTPPTNQNEQES